MQCQIDGRKKIETGEKIKEKMTGGVGQSDLNIQKLYLISS